MARPNKPTALKEVTAAYTKHPERRNQTEPKPEKGIGPASDGATDWKECWDEIVSSIPPGVLGNTDRVWLERTARLLAKSRTEGLTSGDEKSLQTYMSRLGMNPADRAKITAQPDKPNDKADAYF